MPRKNPMNDIRGAEEGVRFDPFLDNVYVCPNCGWKAHSLSATEEDMKSMHRMISPACFAKSKSK